MKRNDLFNSFQEAVFDTDKEATIRAVYQALNSGVSPEEIIFEMVIPTIENQTRISGEGWQWSLGQHFMAAQIASQVTEEMLPRFAHAARDRRPRRDRQCAG